MNSRELAAELATLDKSQREQLLSELPEAKRDELQFLIRELQPLLAAPSVFELMMAEIKKQSTADHSFLHSEARLSQLLSGETIAVRRQLADVLIDGQTMLITAHVRDLLIGFLQGRAENTPPLLPSARQRNGWWRLRR